MNLPNIAGTIDRIDELLDNTIGPDGVKVAVQPDTSKLDAWAWAQANPVPSILGLGLMALVVRKLIQ
jgi:hypothetical protein